LVLADSGPGNALDPMGCALALDPSYAHLVLASLGSGLYLEHPGSNMVLTMPCPFHGFESALPWFCPGNTLALPFPPLP
ncbi:hypothetical protein P7K49_017348, partial [Saguinus oedipus]